MSDTLASTAVPLKGVLDGCPQEQFVVWLDEYSAYLLLGHITADEAQQRLGTDYIADPATHEHQRGWFDRHESDRCVPDGDGCDGDCHEQPWWFRTAEDGKGECVDVTLICAGYVPAAERATSTPA